LNPLSRRRFPLFFLLMGLSGLLPAAPDLEEGKVTEGDVPPLISSPWRSWHFGAPLDRVRSELLSLLKEDGLTIVEEDRAAGNLLTDKIQFDSKRFGVDVSIPPPKAGPKYPWFQMNAMTSGRYGLEGKVSTLGPGQTGVDLRAVLEIQGMDQKIRAMRWVPRYSNGTVEQHYFSRLGFRLIPPPSGESSPR